MTPLPIPAPPLSSQTIGIIVGVVCGVLALLAVRFPDFPDKLINADWMWHHVVETKEGSG